MRALILVLALLLAIPAGAVEPGEMLADPGLEARARALSKEVRCLVCRNESIDDSSAELARDLRVLIRERLEAGDTDPQVLDFLGQRTPASWFEAAPRHLEELLIDHAQLETVE